MNPTPILIQSDMVTLSPYRKLRALCISGAITYNRSWENEARSDQTGGRLKPVNGHGRHEFLVLRNDSALPQLRDCAMMMFVS